MLGSPGLSNPSLRQPGKEYQQVCLDAALETASQPAPSSSLKYLQASLAGALETAEPVALRMPPPSAQKVGWLRSAMLVRLPTPLVLLLEAGGPCVTRQAHQRMRSLGPC